MKNNDLNSIWFQIPFILIMIVRILTKKPSGRPQTSEFEIWGRLIKIATDPSLGRVRLEVITFPLPVLQDKGSKLEKKYQPRLELGDEN